MDGDFDPASGAGGADPGLVRYLRRLVTALTVTMIAGLLVLIALIVIRFRETPARLALPEGITLPEGARAAAFTQGRDWFAVVTEDDRILIYDRASGTLRQVVELRR
jgi:hypothetical protein